MLAPHAGASVGAADPVRDIPPPGRRAELRPDRIDPPATAHPAVEQPVVIDRLAPTWLRAGDEPLLRRVPGPRPRLAAGPRVDPRADDLLGTLERGHGPVLRVVTNEGPPHRGGGGQRRGRPAGPWHRVITVPQPHADGQARPAVRLRRQESIRAEVAGVVRRTGLDRGWSTPAPGSIPELELLGPDRVLTRVGVALQDVGHEVRGLRRDRAFAVGLRRGPDDATIRATDLEDHPGDDPPAGVAEGRVGRRQIERSRLDRAQGAGQAGLEERVPPAGEADAHLGRRRGHGLAADPLQGPDGRDVERVLEGAADEHRPAVQLVRVPRRPVLASVELGRDVQEQAARGEAAGLERRRVDDRLEG